MQFSKPILTLIMTALLTLAPTVTLASESININTASVQQLTQLKGVGEKKAKAIVAYRKKHGKFKSVSALQNVSGIGTSIVKKNEKTMRIK